jgi:hypothetical protein
LGSWNQEGSGMMKKQQENPQSIYTYDEHGTKQVSEQIMDSYNSGVIDQTRYEKEGRNTLL